MSFYANLKTRIRYLKGEVVALYLAARDPMTPWYAKLVLLAVVAYALSPIDLIPDFIPVVGLLDDLVLLPLGILLARKMVPPSVMAECRARALANPPRSTGAGGRAAAIVIVLFWLALAIAAALWAHNAFAHQSGLP